MRISSSTFIWQAPQPTNTHLGVQISEPELMSKSWICDHQFLHEKERINLTRTKAVYSLPSTMFVFAGRHGVLSRSHLNTHALRIELAILVQWRRHLNSHKLSTVIQCTDWHRSSGKAHVAQNARHDAGFSLALRSATIPSPPSTALRWSNSVKV